MLLFWPLDVDLIEISRSLFKQTRNPWLITQFYVLGIFVYFSVFFWVYLGGNGFPQRIGKIRRNKKY